MNPNPLTLDPVLAIIGTQEIVIIGAFVFLLFGAKKIPELMRSLGRAQGEYQHAKRQFEKEIKGDEAKATAAAASPTTATSYSPESDLDKARAKAAELEIPTEGKSLEELNREIAAKTGGPTG